MTLLAQVTSEEATLDDWLWAAFGVMVYNYLMFVFAKDETDGTRKKFNWKGHVGDRWDNWIFSFMMVPIIVIYGEQLWYYLMQWQKWDWKFYDVVFLGSGALAEGIYFVFKKIGTLIKALKGSNTNS